MTIKRMFQSLLMVLGLGPCAVTATYSLNLNLYEREYANGPQKNSVRLKDVLGARTNGKAFLKIDPKANQQHRQLIEILEPGMPIHQEPVRDQVAEILASFPEHCLPHMTLSIVTNPVENLHSFVPGVKDNRRVRAVLLRGCLTESLPECFYNAAETGEIDFTIGMFKAVLKECRAATAAAIETGEPYADAVYAAHPELKKPNAISGAR